MNSILKTALVLASAAVLATPAQASFLDRIHHMLDDVVASAIAEAEGPDGDAAITDCWPDMVDRDLLVAVTTEQRALALSELEASSAD